MIQAVECRAYRPASSPPCSAPPARPVSNCTADGSTRRRQSVAEAPTAGQQARPHRRCPGHHSPWALPYRARWPPMAAGSHGQQNQRDTHSLWPGRK